MSITPESVSTTDYYRASGRFRDLMCRVSPGEIYVCMFSLCSQAEVEEYIDALRKAAIEAKLPSTVEKKS